MRVIIDDGEFRQYRSTSGGYIYNDYSPDGAYGNILHAASCFTLARANTKLDKYFAVELPDAVAWLDANRRDRWRRCELCAP
jgi:hypothetical protein